MKATNPSNPSRLRSTTLSAAAAVLIGALSGCSHSEESSAKYYTSVGDVEVLRVHPGYGLEWWIADQTEERLDLSVAAEEQNEQLQVLVAGPPRSLDADLLRQDADELRATNPSTWESIHAAPNASAVGSRKVWSSYVYGADRAASIHRFNTEEATYVVSYSYPLDVANQDEAVRGAEPARYLIRNLR